MILHLVYIRQLSFYLKVYPSQIPQIMDEILLPQVHYFPAYYWAFFISAMIKN